ncbi:MAG: DUF484 family protein [Alphaproteobacteria bacterium]
MSQLSKDTIVTYLKEHPEVLTELLPPPSSRGQKVVDFQSHLIDRLRREVSVRRADNDDLVDTSRTNLTSQRRVHEAALALLKPSKLADLAWMVANDLRDYLAVDVSVLCIDHRAAWPQREVQSALLLPPTLMAAQFPEGLKVSLGETGSAAEEIFGPMARVVRSQALVRLDLGGNQLVGVLALGDRDPETFESGHGTQLLRFLGDMLAIRLKQLIPETFPVEEARWQNPEIG